MKSSRIKKALLCVLALLIAFALGIFALACVIRPRPLEVGELELSDLSDGEYIGVCQNKLLFAVVRVTVQDHQLQGVELLYHKDGYMAQAEETARRVCARQSLEVDGISGATFTCDTVRKAIENALSASAGKEK